MNRSRISFRPIGGTVYLVGAGPGDPELITIRGLRCLRAADVVLYDALLHPDLLAEASHGAEKIFVGKSVGHPGVGQEEIHRLLIHHARLGKVVVRLKGGDPFVFGRGSEEGSALDAVGIPWQVVSAVSSAFAAPAAAGIPLTHRGVARSFAVVTAHRVDGGDLPWHALVEIDTLVVLMGVAALPQVTASLIEHGRAIDTPAAVVVRGTLPAQQVVVGTLADLALRAAAAEVDSPATIIIGEVVAQRRKSLATRPLDIPLAPPSALQTKPTHRPLAIPND